VTNERRRHSKLRAVTVRLTASEKERFNAPASSRGISESALALIALRGLLNSNQLMPSASRFIREPSTDRITIRLRPGDHKAILDRAARRGIKPAKYLAALVRAHMSPQIRQ
jgi:predicted DNA binding CopG/RHH family protein